MKRIVTLACLLFSVVAIAGDPLQWYDGTARRDVNSTYPLPVIDATGAAAVRNATQTVTIANGASASAEINLADYAVVGIHMPAAWTAANLGWSCAEATGGTFNPTYDTAGNVLLLTTAASRHLDLVGSGDVFSSCTFAKLLSVDGAGAGVNQGAERTITLILAR